MTFLPLSPLRQRRFGRFVLGGGALAAAASLMACTSLVDSSRTFGHHSSTSLTDSGTVPDGAFPGLRSDGASADGAIPKGPSYQEVAFLKSDEPERFGAFGYPVVLSGEEVLVGSAGASVSKFVHAGRGYVIEPTGGTWQQIKSVGSPRPETDGGVPNAIMPTLGARPPGISLAISGDTLILGIAAENVEWNGRVLEDAGAVYVLERKAGVFELVQRLTSSAPRARDAFGIVVALEGDTLAVAAPWDDGPIAPDGKASAEDSGAVYLFHRTSGLFEASGVLRADVIGAGDLFGASLAVNGDLLVVGDPAEQGLGAGNSADPHARGNVYAGAVYTYVRNPANGSWSRDQYLKPEDEGQSGFFGMGVALEGSTLIVGAPTIGRPGSVHVFERATGGFSESGPVLAPLVPTGAQLFGFSVALSGDTLVVGAPLDTSTARGVDGDPTAVNPKVTGSGAAHVFVRRGRVWHRDAYLKASNADSRDLFGLSVAASGSLVGVGAPSESSAGPLGSPTPADNGALWAGAAYLFRRVAP